MAEATKKCRIKRHITGEDVPLMSVTYDCGYKKNETQGMDCCVLKGGNPENHMALVSRKDQVYSGSPQGPSERYCNTLLLVVDSSGKVRMLLHMMSFGFYIISPDGRYLVPQFRTILHADPSNCRRDPQGTIVPTVPCRLTNCTNQISPKKAKLDSTLGLDVSQFGSKKYQRMVNTAKKLGETKAGSSSALEKSIVDIKGSDLEVDLLNASVAGGTTARNELMKRMLPPSNREATEVADVYPVDKLLSQSDLRELEDAANLFLNPPDDPSKDEKFLVYKFYASIKKKTLLKMQLLLYANSLLTFARCKRQLRKGVETIEQISPYSYSLGKKILNEFTTSSGSNRVKPPEMTDKALCHAMVAILLACDYMLNSEWFAGCLNTIRKKHVINLMRVVGLQKTAKCPPNIHILKVPLPPIPTGKLQKKNNT